MNSFGFRVFLLNSFSIPMTLYRANALGTQRHPSEDKPRSKETESAFQNPENITNLILLETLRNAEAERVEKKTRSC